MSLWVCRRCTTKFAVGLSYCPQCTGTDVERDDMPKTTVHGGATNAAAERSEDLSPGSSSEASTSKQETSPETNSDADRKPARTTGSRSKRARTGSSSASSTDGTNETT